ncbi:MAG: DUF1707 SHOCT-like domain-containing protein [Streptosporangiales bacterium]
MRPPHGVRPHDLRASDADRENVVTVLNRALVDGRLSAEEHDERVRAAYAARTLGQLPGLVGDLPSGAENAGLPQLDAGPVSGVFGRETRMGRWVLPATLPINAVVGVVTLDLSAAVFAADDAVVNALCMGGLLHVIAPAAIRVDVEHGRFVRLHRQNARHARTQPTATVLVRAYGVGQVSIRTLKEPRPPRRGLFGRRS